MPERLRVAVVGAGYVAGYHLRALRSLEHVEIVGIADRDLERARSLAQAFGVPRAVADLAELAEQHPALVHVLTPPSAHCAVALQALDLGADVFIEKPMAPTVAECDLILERARTRGRRVAVNHSMLFDPMLRRALRWVDEGRIGEVVGVDFVRGSDYPPYAGGEKPAPYRDPSYPLEDMGVHALYMMEAFLGAVESLDVRWQASGRDPNLKLDEWRVLARCPRGIGYAFLSWNARPMPNELAVYGTRGVIRLDFYLQTGSLSTVKPLPKPILAGVDGLAGSLGRFYQVARSLLRFVSGRLRPSPSIHESVLAFHRAIAAGEPPPTTGEDGRRIVALLEAPAAEATGSVPPLVAPAPGPKVLVTGANGFLGRHLVARLVEKSVPVRALVRRAPERAVPGVGYVVGDLGDPEAVRAAMSGIETVYHVGATMRGGKADFERGTVWGTRNVVEAALAVGVRRLVHVSSLGILDYGGLRDGARVDESAALEPHPERRGHYAWAKLEAEGLVRAAARERGLCAVVLRPGQIVGPGAERVAPYGTIALGPLWVVVGWGRVHLPLVHVDDVAGAILAAAERGPTDGRVLHLVAPEEVRQRAYLRALGDHLAGVKVVYVPKSLLWLAALAAETLGALLKRAVPLTRYRLAAIRDLRFDCAAARRDLGWTAAARLPGVSGPR
jgi:predicted dehydrogenase/nucleoside-diphosphate-sugar epimerase